MIVEQRYILPMGFLEEKKDDRRRPVYNSNDGSQRVSCKEGRAMRMPESSWILTKKNWNNSKNEIWGVKKRFGVQAWCETYFEDTISIEYDLVGLMEEIVDMMSRTSRTDWEIW